MPKDALGHGSNPRGAQETDKRLKLGASKGGLTLGERYQATMDKRNKTGIYADNEQAASALASGPKSAPAPVHDAMLGPVGSLARGQNASTPPSRGPAPWYDKPINEPHSYHPGAVNDAIKQSERRGGKVGGKERSLIHAVLKGRGK